jgi:dihydrofolate reductase
MRKVIVSNLISLDGYFAGPAGEIDWFANIADKEFEDYAVGLMGRVDTMIFGRSTYELMESYWPTATSATDDPRIIEAMNNYQKVVFSRTMKSVKWKNTTLISRDAAPEIAHLKAQPGKDMVIYGSGSLVASLTQHGLIDDYRIFVSPLVLGQGKTLFSNQGERVHLRLQEARAFSSGLALLHYER